MPAQKPTVRVIRAEVAVTPKPASMDHTADVVTFHITKGKKSRTFTVVFAAGKFNAPAADVANYHHRVMTHYNADLLVTTEAQEKDIAAHEREIEGSKFAVTKTAEYMFVYRRSTIRRTMRPLRRVRMTRVLKGKEDWRNLFIGDCWLVFKPLKLRIEAIAGHYPSSVQAGSHWGPHAALNEASQQGIHAVGRFSHQIGGTVLRLFFGDWNLDLHDHVWVVYIDGALGAQCCWSGHEPKKGDHAGNRLIGGVFWRVD